jgi:hypothetical protein
LLVVIICDDPLHDRLRRLGPALARERKLNLVDHFVVSRAFH